MIKKTKQSQQKFPKLKQGDEVIIIAGKDKGKRGRIKAVMHQSNKVLVEGCQMVRKHVRPNPQANQQGSIVSQEAAIDVSNVMIFDPTSQKGRRIGVRMTDGDNKKMRAYRVDGELVEVGA